MPRLRDESIYRRVSLRMHADEKVRKLSRPPPNGYSLWDELIHGEQTGIIPGLFRIGESAFAEQLGWPLKGFRAAWQEIQDAGLAVKADWNARLVWVQNAIKHDRPKNPNQVIHWRDAWDNLPECALKREAELYLERFLAGLPGSEAMMEAFNRIRGNSYRNSSANSSPNGSTNSSGNNGGNRPGNQDAVSSKQEDVVSSKDGECEGKEPTACEFVDNSEFGKLNPSEKAEVTRLLAAGDYAEARRLLGKRGAA
jgi:hypothetical protein